LFNTNEQFSSFIMTRTRYIRWDDNDVRFVLNPTLFDNASSLK